MLRKIAVLTDLSVLTKSFLLKVASMERILQDRGVFKK